MSATAPLVAVDIDDDAFANAGALVYWRLEGSLDPAELAVLWKQAGLDPSWLPQCPAPTTALSRAMRGLAARRALVRPLDARAGHALVRESAEGDDLAYSVGLTVKLDPAGRPVFSPADHPMAASVRAAYFRNLEVCDAHDIGSWLSDLVRRFDGTSPREAGGFYYLPPSRVAQWDVATAAIRRVSAHRTFKIPAMKTAEAVAAILDAIEQEATGEAAKMEEELAEVIAAANDGGGKVLGSRALKGRVARVEAVEAKVGRYEALLGTKLEALRGRLISLRGNLGAAALLAMDREDATP